MKRPALKNYQKRAVSYALKNPYSILALDPGLGKSRIAIEVQKHLSAKCLVICPSYLVLNWAKEIEKWGGACYTAVRKGSEIPQIRPLYGFIIISYDLAQKAEHLFEWADMVVLDEAHAIKSMKAKRTEFIHKNVYENSIQRVLLLTGTPIKNRVQEFYSLLALCFYNPRAADSRFLELFPTEIDFADHFSFREQYTMEINNRYVTILKWHGIKNVDQLKGWLSGKYLRIRSSDVLDLPPLSYKSMLISETPDTALLSAFEEFFEAEDAASVNPTAKAGAALKKVPFTIKYVENLLEEVDCCLVYSDHVGSAHAIAEHFKVPAITGKMPASKRSQLADEFQAGNGKVLVATIGSMKEGKDLYRSHHIVFNDYPWVPGDLKQVIYRIQRIGQKRPCTVHRIQGSPQDEYIMDTIETKIKTIERVT